MTYAYKKVSQVAFILLAALLPFVTFATSHGKGFDDLNTFFGQASAFISKTLIPVLLAIAFLFFVVGMVRYFLYAQDDNTEGKKSGKNLMYWGILAFVLMVSIWGIVTLVSEGLNLGGEDLKKTPQAPGFQVSTPKTS